MVVLREIPNGHVMRRELDVIRRNPTRIRSMLEVIGNDLDDAEASNDALLTRMLGDLMKEEQKFWSENNMPAYWAAKATRRNFEAMVGHIRARNEELKARLAWLMQDWDNQFN